MQTAALVLAAGCGARMGGETPKAYVELAHQPMVVHALTALALCPAVDRVVPVIAPADLGRWEALAERLAAIPKLVPPVRGGAERQDSVRAGLASLGSEFEWVAVHDAARPLVTAADLERVFAVARESGAAILARPVSDTLKRVSGGHVQETPDRSHYYAAQTPQVFRVDLLRQACAKAESEGFIGTDDAQLVERLGVSVRVVEGSPENIKVTFPADLLAAETILRDRGAQ